MLRITATGLAESDRALRRFAAVSDLRPFWSELGEHLADEAQRRWPLRRWSGKLRESLTWHGDRLGKHGVFESSPDRLTFGSERCFYSRFASTRRAPQRHADNTVDPYQRGRRQLAVFGVAQGPRGARGFGGRPMTDHARPPSSASPTPGARGRPRWPG